jgi:hypothetical protein
MTAALPGRGRRGADRETAVAATVLDGETASRCAKDASPVRDREKGALQGAAGLRSSLRRFSRQRQ